MSRIGRLPIAVPATVDVTIDGRTLTVKGPKGTLTRALHPDMTVSREGYSDLTVGATVGLDQVMDLGAVHVDVIPATASNWWAPLPGRGR